MDVDRAAELYAAGWTLGRIGAELGVHPSTVAYRLHREGMTLRRGGARRHDVDTQHILDLRDQGMSMAAIAAQVGMSLRGVWARYYRGRPAKRAVPSASDAPVGMISWQKVLINALFEHDAIGVQATVAAYVGREPTLSQITAARRAAHRLVVANWARAVHVPVRLGDTREVNHLVLVRSDATAEHDQLLDAATCRPPAPDRGLEPKLTALEKAARSIELDQLSVDQAGYLATRLRAAAADLTRLSRSLERQAKRR